MSYSVIIGRMTLALVLGLLIGLERQLTGHTVGIRINVLICLGTCFFTLFPASVGSDQVFRVASSIISGVGFLCSAAIFKGNGSVRGMNTAGTLWCTSAIGILTCLDTPLISIIATFILISSNLFLRPISRQLVPLGSSEDSDQRYKISVICHEDAEHLIRKQLINENSCRTLFLTNLESGDVIGDKVEVLAEYCSVGRSKKHVLEEIVGRILVNDSVVSAGWEVSE